MNAQERLRKAIAAEQERLCAMVPRDREAAILALILALDRLPPSSNAAPVPDLVTGRRLTDLGGTKALQLSLEAIERTASTNFDEALESWAERFLAECGRLAEAEVVLAHCETGFMRLVDDGHGRFDAWIATRQPPPSWRERADIDWWAAWLAARHAPELRAFPSSPGADDDTPYRRIAGVHVQMMGYQLGYPPDAVIGSCSIQIYREVLIRLIALALQARDRGEAGAPQSEQAVVSALASDLGVDPALIRQAVAAFTLDRENAAYHAATPGVAAAPVVRVDAERIVLSVYGLTTEPLFFLMHELRRRDPPAYHNSAHLREGVFRQDLYALFPEKRCVTSAGRIALRRESGDVRTDVDAVVFDRKTGTLGLFELKSQDPFARSPAELARQRDNVLYANRQLSGVLAWLQRHGADALLSRVDARTAKTFRAQKVYPFVLGRYLVHFNDGPAPDRRAAWGTWPQVLRLVEGEPFRASDANPLATLFNRLTKDAPLVRPPSDDRPREIYLGPTRLTVYPSYAAFQASATRAG
jgi:hypothetical protein